MDSPQRKNVNATSLHSQILNRTYHYNSILGAKSQIDNSNPEKHLFSTLHNKRYKQLFQQRLHQNKKLLSSLIEIDKKYKLYDYSQVKKSSSVRSSQSFSNRKNKIQAKQKLKSLKNQFKQKMNVMKISQYNTKVYDKIVNIKSYIQDKKQLKKWNKKIDFYGSLIKSRQHQSEELNKSFFQTFVRIKKGKAKRSLIKVVNKQQNNISTLGINSKFQKKY